MKTPAASRAVREVAIGGALAFAASSCIGVYAYAVVFGRPSAAPSLLRPVTINVVLFTAFGLHHSVFARTGLKRRVRDWVGPDLERPVYVGFASALFFLMTWWWQPVPGTLWTAGPGVGWLLTAVQVGAAALIVVAGRLTDVRDLAGLRAGIPRSQEPTAPVSRGPYGVIRHPLYLAVLLLLWSVHLMTATRLLFAALFTLYVLIAIPLEERDLRRGFGDGYGQYARRVRFRLLPGIY